MKVGLEERLIVSIISEMISIEKHPKDLEIILKVVLFIMGSNIFGWRDYTFADEGQIIFNCIVKHDIVPRL